MPAVTFTQEDLLERKQLQAGWRELRMKTVDEGPGKTDPTALVWACLFVIDGGNDDGVPVRHWFSEKAMGRIVDFVKCFIKGDMQAGRSYELTDAVGQNVMGWVEYDIKQGFNTIKDWKKSQKV